MKRVLSFVVVLVLVLTAAFSAVAASECPLGENCPSKDFTDVAAGSWYHEAVDSLLLSGLMQGVSEEAFAPQAGMTRAMFAAVLYRAEEIGFLSQQIEFGDVAEDAWYADAVAWAASQGLMVGVGDGKFAPNMLASREQIISVYYRYIVKNDISFDEGEANLSDFKDSNTVSPWAEEAMSWAVSVGLLVGDEQGCLNPQEAAKRSDAAVIISRYEEKEKNLTDAWDGTVDTSWYNDTDMEFTLNTAEELAGLAELVDGGNTFAGKTILLDCNMDMEILDENGEPISFDPIGSYVQGQPFCGTFDGQGHTILNVYQNGWALGNGYWDGDDWGMGLFALLENATVKNLTLDGSSLPSEANIMGTVAGLAANCTFENITITDAYVGNHSWYSGGIVGWAEGDVKFINCDIDADSSISSQWGDFNNANGGLVGGVDPEGTYYFEDCDVACVIDAYNDVTSAYEWYSYRNCGMLVGDTGASKEIDGTDYADASHIICKNVTVTYGGWANYHYCEFGSAGYPYCRVEAGESTGVYGNARVGEYFDADGNKVVDENHTHNEGEMHNELIAFDQLFGGPGGDRYCTYGTASHEGVTIIYNN